MMPFLAFIGFFFLTIYVLSAALSLFAIVVVFWEDRPYREVDWSDIVTALILVVVPFVNSFSAYLVLTDLWHMLEE